MATSELDDLSGIPRYVQIAKAVEAEIRAGTWPSGQPAPSRVQLAQQWGVARETAAHAHRWLVERGYLVSVAGVGMVVTPPDRWAAEA
jgi:GntR family transcriptional regulator